MLFVVVFCFIGCDDDYNTVGGGIIGGNNFESLVYEDAEINVQNQSVGPVQTNGLPAQLLGVYQDPVFGERTASILTQLSLSEFSPDFGVHPLLDSVMLTIPYYHTQLTSSGEELQFRLDSLYGNGAFKLTVSSSNYFLNEFDPATDFEKAQKYYSDLGPEVEANLGATLYSNNAFIPSNERVRKIVGEDEEADTTYYNPRLMVTLSPGVNSFFQENILNKAGSPELMNMNNFRNFLRGIYIQAESLNNGEGNMMLMDLSHQDAGFKLYYSHEVEAENGNIVIEKSEYDIGFGGIKVNVFEGSVSYPEDDNIYLSGFGGSLSVIELFSDEQLEELRANDWLINEANLTFFVNQQVVEGGEKEPERIFLFNMETKEPLVDYYYDYGTTSANAVNSRKNHLGRLQRTSSGEGISYKIKITDHINSILNKDSTNVKLGLITSTNIELLANTAVRDNEEVDKIPTASVLNPEGTVLYGPNATEEDKRLKLKIYYSETN